MIKIYYKNKKNYKKYLNYVVNIEYEKETA